VVTSRRFVLLAVAGVLLLGTVVFVGCALAGNSPGGPQPRVVQPGAPGQSGRTLSSDEVGGLRPPAHNVADTQFMLRMIDHHGQALEMTALVRGRSDSSEIALLAGRIDVSQRDEIAQMQRWLADRGEPSGPHASHAAHATAMPGMLTAAQLDQLRRAKGATFDRLFLTFMIGHHQGALQMVAELYAAGGGLEPASDRFAREVQADQDVEIRRMTTMLAADSPAR
jgi:uncharacterized protein (DUF305 family)